MNTSIKELLDLLLAQHGTLSIKLDEMTDPVLGRAILREMREILHRADLLQNVLMVETTQRLETAADRVRTADKALTKQLKEVDDGAKLIKNVSRFLASMDKVIDIAKTVAVL